MKHPHDNIRVGTITFVYSVTVLTRWCRSSSKKWTRHWLKLVLYLGSNGDEASSR
ncbi:DUF1317 family protein [Escherichia coli]|uniref:DUF1317 family protein n=1 Tax=Escherichia coli TaxID=562 RepID=UPI003F4AC866